MCLLLSSTKEVLFSLVLVSLFVCLFAGLCQKYYSTDFQKIQCRTEIVKEVFREKRQLFVGKMNLKLKKRIMKCLVWSMQQKRDVDADRQTDTQTDKTDTEAWRKHILVVIRITLHWVRIRVG